MTGNNLCSITPSKADAGKSYASGNLACFGLWKNLPSWLTPSTTKMEAVGKVPSAAGSYPVSYDLILVDGSGTESVIGTFSGNVEVSDIDPIAVTVTPANGRLLGGDGGPVYLVDGKGKIGSYEVDGGGFATVRATMKVGNQTPVIKAGLKDGQSNELAVGTLLVAPWVPQELQIALQYEGLNDQSQNRTEIVKVAAMPPSGFSAKIEKPLQLVTTMPFSLKGKVGVAAGSSSLTYSAQGHGNWKAWLAIQNEYGLTPLTEPQVISTMGTASFDNLTYDQVAGHKIVLVADVNGGLKLTQFSPWQRFKTDTPQILTCAA